MALFSQGDVTYQIGMLWGRFICLSVLLSVPPYIWHVYHQNQYTQGHSQDASLLGRACSFSAAVFSVLSVWCFSFPFDHRVYDREFFCVFFFFWLVVSFYSQAVVIVDSLRRCFSFLVSGSKGADAQCSQIYGSFSSLIHLVPVSFYSLVGRRH